MLFNTLDYARFFAIVFVVGWVLVRPRLAPLLPWVAVAMWAALHPSARTLVVAGAALGLTLALVHRTAIDERPTWPIAAASVVINLVALGVFTYGHAGVDPVTYAVRSLGIPLGFTAPVALGSALVGIAVVRARKIRLIFILGASYVFYAHWDWRFLPLIFGSSTIDWLLGHAIARSKSPVARKAWLAGTVFVNLGVLAVFKYFHFGVDTARALLGSFGVDVPEPALRVALPIGISFFTFESMSYVIDVYRRHIEPQESYLEYLAFVAFFPHLVAGPIIRPRDLLPQLAGPARFSASEGSEGLFLIALGLLKKITIGDYLALNLVDRVFDAPLQYSALECYAAILGYALQIYCDFSGYTDIAIGSALLLGVRFPLNFDAPYKAENIQDFWRRWHISLSTWLRDYLYVPLGGNRKGELRTYTNLMLTMLLGGLWHGASFTFVVWGGLHGVALAVTRWFTERRARAGREPNPSLLYRVACVLATFHLVCAAWVFFRAATFGEARVIFERLATLTTFHPNLPVSVLAVLAAGLLSHFIPERWFIGARETFIRAPAYAQGSLLFLAGVALHEMASADAVPFVYFQF